ncbi:glutamic-type intramembrane protease PrsW [Bacillus carboniphilus]|uniref:Protease PrsW n=1 Tax=Bacillus carboniphilus TaxID=86663 RepID=A0ABY9JYX2_9BACI|nr:glutamic-type intramembrane protease PrsW [Bacillus carboniphilus]WLR43757.1 glutamic-type intramembrane protease PrsW [Bacillus carboniphilus]
MIGIISAGVAPSLAILCYFYLKNECEGISFSLIIRSFILGAILVFPIMFIQYVLEVEEVFQSPIVIAFFSVALLEEFFKWFIYYFIIFQHYSFDEHYDGIIYGLCISLGFATIENILYLFTFGVDDALGRALLPVSGHALFGVLMGYYFGKGKFSYSKNRFFWPFIALFFPVLFHGLFDLILMSKGQDWKMIITPFMVFLWWFSLRKAKQAREIYHKSHEQLSDFNSL